VRNGGNRAAGEVAEGNVGNVRNVRNGGACRCERADHWVAAGDALPRATQPLRWRCSAPRPAGGCCARFRAYPRRELWGGGYQAGRSAAASLRAPVRTRRESARLICHRIVADGGTFCPEGASAAASLPRTLWRERSCCVGARRTERPPGQTPRCLVLKPHLDLIVERRTPVPHPLS
jgi:hypothetical protein